MSAQDDARVAALGAALTLLRSKLPDEWRVALALIDSTTFRQLPPHHAGDGGRRAYESFIEALKSLDVALAQLQHLEEERQRVFEHAKLRHFEFLAQCVQLEPFEKAAAHGGRRP